MHVVRINDVTLHVKGQTVFIFDFFGDLSETEIHYIIAYLIDEGFICEEKEVLVNIKSESFVQKSKAQADKKKS